MAKKLSDIEKKAAMKALGDYRGEAQKLMKDKMKKMKKVTVASDSKEGLEAGLEKAEELLESDSSLAADDEYEDEEEMEDDSDEMSEDEINAKIQELMALQKKKKSK